MEMLPPDQEPLPIRSTGEDAGLPKKVEGYIVLFNKILFWIAGVGLVGMLLLIVGDVIGIKIFRRPIPGGIEWVAFLATIAIAFAIGFTQIMHGHVAVDFIVEKFPRRAKLIIDVITIFFSVCLFAALAWYTFKYAGKLKASGEVSMTQNIPFYPFVYAMGVCFVATCLVIITHLVKAIARVGAQWSR